MKCRDCEFRKVDFMTTSGGKGIEFSYCSEDITTPRMVDPNIERECDRSEEKVESLEVKNAS